MRGTKLAVVLGAVVFLAAGTAHAERGRYYDRAGWSPFAANVWAGVGYDYLNGNGGTLTGSGYLGLNFGGDVGLRFNPVFAVVVLAEYQPILTSGQGTGIVNAGAGIRIQPAWTAEFLLAANYSRLSGAYGERPGFGLKAMGFAPLGFGFGPYLQVAYNNFDAGAVTLVSVNGGISYSF